MLDKRSFHQSTTDGNVQCSDIPTVKYFVFCHIVQRINQFIYIFKKLKKEREKVPQVPIQKTQRKYNQLFLYL
jgi:hypothetical protein